MPTLHPPEPDPPAREPAPHPQSHPQHPPPPARRFGTGALVLCGCLAAFVGLMLGALGTLALQGFGSTLGQGAAAPSATGEEASGGTPLEDAVNACGLDAQAGASLGDDGHSLNLDTKGSEDLSGLDYADVDCVLTELEAPDYVFNQIYSTRALDGRLSAEWEGTSATWSYHPNSGLNLQLVLE